MEVLRRLTVKGGVGKVIEYTGRWNKVFNSSRKSNHNKHGCRIGSNYFYFPSDEVTREFLKAQKREDVWTELKPDEDAEYDEVVEINLDELEPLAAAPHSPDNVKKVSEFKDVKVDQVAIGSCTNSSIYGFNESC